MNSNESMVIVGGGLAAASAARTLRSEGFDGAVHVVASESHLPYERPPLSKEYLTTGEGLEKVYPRPAEWYDEHQVDVHEGTTATRLDRDRRVLALSNGRELGYGRVLLATGAQPRRLEIAGATARGIHYLRTIEQSEALREAIAGGDKRVAIVGAGWIGLEVAAAARGYGNEVTIIGREEVPLEGPLGAELGRVFQALHESHGTVFRLSESTLGFETSDGRVTGVVAGSGTVAADVVVIGVGAQPAVGLAVESGLAVDNGVLVDAGMRTNDPAVFAAGDVANAWHPVVQRHLRNEHWATAKGTGAAAARAMLDHDVEYADIPYFYTDQWDLGMEYSGYSSLAATARVVYRGSLDTREFVALWLVEEKVVAGMNVNVWDVNDSVQELIRSGRRVDVARLTDTAVPLGDV